MLIKNLNFKGHRDLVAFVLKVRCDEEDLRLLAEGEMEELQNNLILLKGLAKLEVMSEEAKKLMLDYKLLTGHVKFLARTWCLIESSLSTRDPVLAKQTVKLLYCYSVINIILLIHLNLLSSLYLSVGSDDLYTTTMLLVNHQIAKARLHYESIGDWPSENNALVFGQLWVGLTKNQMDSISVFRDFLGVDSLKGRPVHIFNSYYQEWMVVCGNSQFMEPATKEVSTCHRQDKQLPPDSLFLYLETEEGILLFSCMAGGFLFSPSSHGFLDRNRRKVLVSTSAELKKAGQ